jgi:iron complex outermembrane recepter protein
MLRTKALAALFASTLLATSPALAQDAPAADDNGAPADIVVTATKRSESLQKVPISITALTGETLEKNQVSSFDDYVKLLPSVSYQSFGPGQAQLYFRGIASGGDGSAVGPLPGSGLYIDETPVTTIFSSVDVHAYDLSRVEALAGPQGTLYGASSLSGTLRVITNKPDPKGFSGSVDAEVNKYDKGDFGGSLEGYVNLPLSNSIALRVVGFYDRKGGYIDNTASTRTYQRPRTVGTDLNGDPIVANAPLTINNAALVKSDYNDVETYGGRAALGIDLDDDWTVTPSIIYQHQKTNGQFLFDPRAGDLQNHDFVPSSSRDNWYLASLTIQGKLSDWDVTYSGSYLRRKFESVADYSYFNVAYDTYTDYNYLVDSLGRDIDPTQSVRGFDKYGKMAHELRVSSPSTDRFRLTAGLFMQRQIDDRIANYTVPAGLSRAVAPFSSPVPGAGPNDLFFSTIHRVDRDYAVFGEAAFDILPNVTVLGGIRGFIANNTLDGFSGGSGAVDRQITLFNCTGTTAQQCPNIKKKYVESGETHKINVTWKVDNDRLVYATYSTGFRPGGNNRDAFALGRLQSIPPYRADTLTNFELGWKTQWFDRRLKLNGAVFWEKWKDVQYSLPGLLGIFYTVNAGNARSRGAEASLSLTLGGLTLATSGTYVDAQITKAFSTVAAKGTRLPVTPKLKVNGSARYDFQFGDNDAYLQAGLNYQSGTTSSLTATDALAIGPTKAFTTADFSAGVKLGTFSIGAYVQNAFDQRGILSKNVTCAPNLCGSFARLYPTQPRIFGLKVGTKF